MDQGSFYEFRLILSEIYTKNHLQHKGHMDFDVVMDSENVRECRFEY